MKINFLKYIFVVFAMSIICFAVYILYFKDIKTDNLSNENSKGINEKEIITDLRLAISNFDTINPLISNNKEVLNIDKLIFDSLINITNDYKIEYNLASECSKISDTTYIIKIIDGIKWQDGTKFTVDDVIFTINTIKKGKSIYLQNVNMITNMQIIDENTLRVELGKPVEFFEYNLTFPIVSCNYYINENFYETNKIPMGTGMYKIAEVTENQIKLEKNTNWWNLKKNTKIETINIKIVKQAGEVYNNFKLGNIDFFITDNDNIEEYIGNMGYKKQEVNGREFVYLAFNCENKILKNIEVRNAICYGINTKSIISELELNKYIEANYPLDYGSYLYDEKNKDSTISYNLELAKKILKENDWKYKNKEWNKKIDNSIKKINLVLTVNSNNIDRVKIAENIKRQLSSIGINITVNKVSETTYKEILKNKNYEIILTGVYNSICPNLESFFGEDNLQRYKQDEIYGILKDIKNIKNEDLLKEKYNKIFNIYKEEKPFMGICRNKYYIIKSDGLVGEMQANNYFNYYDIYNWYRI